MKKAIFYGVGTAIITPFDKDYNVDYKSLDRLIDYQLSNNVNALIVCGTTGEASALSYKERIDILKYVKNKVKNKIPIIAGVGSNNYTITQKLMQDAKNYADAYLIVTPYYNKTTQTGLEILYKNYATNSTLPILIYNVPSRTGLCVMPETYDKLKKVNKICGVKEANCDVGHFAQSIALSGDKLDFYCGNDDLTLAELSLGAKGVISVVSNVFPKKVGELCSCYFNCQNEKATKIQLQLMPFIKSMFCVVNPIPVKYALSKIKLCQNVLRMPLTPLEQDKRAKIDEILGSFKLI